MLDWLKKAFQSAAGVIPDAIREWVYNQVYAVFSFLGTIVNHVAAAWHAMYTWVNSLYTAVETFAHAVYAYLYKLVKVLLPQILNWVNDQLAQLTGWVWGYITGLIRSLDSLRRYLLAQISAVTSWVLHSVLVRHPPSGPRRPAAALPPGLSPEIRVGRRTDHGRVLRPAVPPERAPHDHPDRADHRRRTVESGPQWRDGIRHWAAN